MNTNITTTVISRYTDADGTMWSTRYGDAFAAPLDRIGEVMAHRYGEWGRWSMDGWGEVIGYRRVHATDRRGRPIHNVVTVDVEAAHQAAERGRNGREVEVADLRLLSVPVEAKLA